MRQVAGPDDGFPLPRTDAGKSERLHGLGDGLESDGLRVGTAAGEDSRQPVDPVGAAVEPGRFLLDARSPNHAVRGLPVDPNAVVGSRHFARANHRGQ